MQFEIRIRIPEAWRRGLLAFVVRAAELPRGVRKATAVLIFIIVAMLFMSGALLVFASFMHLVVTRMDQPPALSGPVIITSADPVYHVDQNSGKSTTYVVVPHPTLVHGLDRVIESMQSPETNIVQSDAVDAGFWVQQAVHQWLTGLFDKATRVAPPESQPALPLQDGQ